MAKKQHRIRLPLTLISLSFATIIGTSSQAAIKETGTKGAEIYCYMRSNGNEHEVSWNAAYEVIKRQANSLFKTSPKHAAVMIIEAVVQEPNDFQGCGSYLGDLFGGSIQVDQNLKEPEKLEKGDRYSY